MYVTSSVTAVSPLPGEHCGTVCLNSFGSRTSPLDNLNDCLNLNVYVWLTEPRHPVARH